VASIPGYQEAWKKAFPDQAEPTIDGIAQAIGAFERKLITKDRLDKWLEGDDAALNADELQGLVTYKELNCNMCHMGNLLGGNMQQKLGLMASWEGNPDDGQMFKVPSLRNVAKTAPYLHDGSSASLEEVTVKMAKYQLGKDLTPEQTKALVAFMGALTGELPPAELISKPELPESGPDTPKPDPN
jgi:cytochrome c peroxidase